MAVSTPTLLVAESLGTPGSPRVSASMSGGVGAPDHSFDISSEFIGLDCSVLIWEDVPAGSYTISQVWTTTNPSDTSSLSVTGGSGSRVILVQGFASNFLDCYVVEVTGAGTVGASTEIGLDGVNPSANISSVSGGRVFAVCVANWVMTLNQTQISTTRTITTDRYVAFQHADGTGSTVAMNFTGTVDQKAYIALHIEQAAAGGSITFDEDYQLILPVAAAW
jgi:hypothetical protein